MRSTRWVPAPRSIGRLDRTARYGYRRAMLLAITDLAVSRGDLVLADGVSLTVEGGGALVVTGANGSGKSTLLRAIGGLHPPDRGAIALTIGGAGVSVAENAHLLGHANAMKADLSVRENLAFWARALEGGAETEADELIGEAADALALRGLLDLPFGYLSAGQRRRVALARLWVAPRPLWLLDEPTAALDARSEGAVRDMIAAHRAEGGMVIAATHVDLGLPDAAALSMDAR